MINNLEIANCIDNVNKNLLANRISVALFSYGLNEFYVAFRYLKAILLYTFNTCNICKNSIKEAIMIVSKQYNVTNKTIVCALNNLYQNLPHDFFYTSPLFLKIKMNCYHKTQFLAEMVLLDLKKY